MEADGDVHLREHSSRTGRYLRIEVIAPGHELPRRAVFEYEEWYRATGASWAMTAYEYEVRLATGTFGRKAYHWHDDAYHAHCQERDAAVSHPHYRGYEVSLLDDARPEFLRIFSAGRVDCAGLHPMP